MLRSFNKTLLFIASIFVLGATAVLAAQGTNAPVSGQVRDITGTPIQFANAELKLQDPPRTIYSVRTDQEGKFQFTVLAAGTYTLKLVVPGFKLLAVRSIQVASEEPKVLPPLRLDIPISCAGPFVDYFEPLPDDRTSGNLSGSVLTDQNRPLAGANIQVLCEDGKVCGETKSDEAGEFILFNMPPDDGYTIRVNRFGFYPLQETGYEVRARFDAVYLPMTLEQCLNGNCDPQLRPKRPIVVCE